MKNDEAVRAEATHHSHFVEPLSAIRIAITAKIWFRAKAQIINPNSQMNTQGTTTIYYLKVTITTNNLFTPQCKGRVLAPAP